MVNANRTIPIHDPAAHQGCGACLQDSGTPVCRASLGADCAAPRLQGPPQEVQRVLAVLAPALGFAADAVDAGSGLVASLSVRAGEVELQLAIGAQCGGAALADAAFQALRGLLPDTDIYVSNAA